MSAVWFSEGEQWWTRLQPVRTVADVEIRFAVFAGEPFQHHRIADEARRLRKLGMSLRAIGGTLGVDENVVRKALAARAEAGASLATRLASDSERSAR